ncbi:di-heme oxidoredictase family protein [Tautonia marina]|uniref:di-heme oxidoredictase family protein n=1 Tax=Tautonia marina TaxID=2653855 RepID=UPI00126058A0|nr:di-heme oxidoredictase family protein [Tautonia marina]
MSQAFATSVPGIVGPVLMMLVVPVHLQAQEDDSSPAAPGVIELGRDLFTHRWMPGDPKSRGGDGLGPVFNAQSCLDCHDRGGIGGAGHSARNIDIASATGQDGSAGTGFFYAFSMNMGPNRFEYRIGTPPAAAVATNRRGAAAPPANLAALEAIHPGFRESPSVVLHRFGTDPAYGNWRAEVPGRHGSVSVRITQRNPTALFGVALIDDLPDEVLEDAARRSRRAKATRGRLARTADGRIGRFGWKGQTATLDEFVRSAAAGELGLEVPGHHQALDPRLPGIGAPGPDLNQGDLDALLAFVRSLPRPTITVDDELATRIEAGASTFRSIGCASCHVPDLGPIEGIYSDLLLHDMGPRLVDTGSYIAFGARPAAAPAAALDADAPATDHEWRTPPLWGLADSGPYLHDGRAQTISEAILLHDGQGAAAARRFAQLSSPRKEQLGAFLLSLTAPAEADDPPRLLGIGADE